MNVLGLKWRENMTLSVFKRAHTAFVRRQEEFSKRKHSLILFIWLNEVKWTVEMVRSHCTWNRFAGSILEVAVRFLFFFFRGGGIWLKLGSSTHLHLIWISCLHNSTVNGELLRAATAVLPFLPRKNDTYTAAGGGGGGGQKCLKKGGNKNLQVMWWKKKYITNNVWSPEDIRGGMESNIHPPCAAFPLFSSHTLPKSATPPFKRSTLSMCSDGGEPLPPLCSASPPQLVLRSAMLVL